MNRRGCVWGPIGVLMVFSCSGGHWDELVKIDPEQLKAPTVLGVSAAEDRVVEAVFDKDVWMDTADLAIHPALQIGEVMDGSRTVRVILLENGRPGVRYTFEALVKDARGNTTSFLYHFYGFNSRVPKLLINEFITTASTTVFTRLEIAVRTDGNMGGVAFFEGTKSYADKTFVFPSFEVKAGDFIVLHFKPDGVPGEIDETSDKTVATGKGASPTAFDFWAQGTGALSKENDVLSLYSNPEGELLDGVLYSIKEYEEGMKYNGFGTSIMLNKAKELAADGGWKIAGDEPFPVDGVNPKGATSTRSLCRSGDYGDTDNAEDWHIVPTGKASFGRPNSDDRYVP